MYTVEAFTTMLMEFAQNLKAMFPDDPSLALAVKFLSSSIKANPRAVVDMFMKEVEPFADRIRAKDGTVFAEVKSTIVEAVNLKEIWARDLSEKTRESIWSYLNTLMVIGSMIQSMSDDMLSGIEELATKLAANPENMDLSKLMGNLSGLMK